MKFLTHGVLALSLLAGMAAGPAFAQTSTGSTGTMDMTRCPDDGQTSTNNSTDCPFEKERRKSDTTQPNNVDAENPSTGGVDPNGSTGSTQNQSNSNGDSSQDSGGSSSNNSSN